MTDLPMVLHGFLIVAFQTGDYITTRIGIARGAEELNPLWRHLVKSPWKFAVVSVLTTLWVLALVLYPWEWFGHSHYRGVPLWVIRAWIHHVVFSAVLLSNLRVLVRETRK